MHTISLCPHNAFIGHGWVLSKLDPHKLLSFPPPRRTHTHTQTSKASSRNQNLHRTKRATSQMAFAQPKKKHEEYGRLTYFLLSSNHFLGHLFFAVVVVVVAALSILFTIAFNHISSTLNGTKNKTNKKTVKNGTSRLSLSLCVAQIRLFMLWRAAYGSCVERVATQTNHFVHVCLWRGCVRGSTPDDDIYIEGKNNLKRSLCAIWYCFLFTRNLYWKTEIAPFALCGITNIYIYRIYKYVFIGTCYIGTHSAALYANSEKRYRHMTRGNIKQGCACLEEL